MVYVLTVIMALGGGPATIAFKEFSSPARCDFVKRSIVAKSIFPDRRIVAFCAPK